MLTRIKQLCQSRFVRNVAIVATGTAGAQALTMAFAPFITRLYGPEAFGLLGTFMAILAVLTPIAALTYPIAIVLPKSDADAKGIAKLSAILAFSLALIASVILLLAGDWVANMLGLQTISAFFLLIPVAMLFSAFQQILTQWLIRKKQFQITARVAVMQSLIINSTKTGVGWYYPVGAMLIIIAVIGHVLHALMLWTGIHSRAEAQPNETQSTGSVRELAKRHRDFPLYRAPQVALNSLTQSLPVLILVAFFGPTAAGLFALTKSVLAAPAYLVGQSVGHVFYPKAAELHGLYAELKRVLIKATFALFFIGLVVFSPVLIAGPWLFSIVFGTEWGVAGELARWVAIWMVFSLAARPAINTIPIVDLQGMFLVFEVVFLPLKVFSLFIGVYLCNPTASVALYSITSSLFYFLLFMIVRNKLTDLSRTAMALGESGRQ